MGTELSKYYDALDAHDWWYQMSDDYSVYRKGRAEQAHLKAISHESPQHKKLYEEMSEYKLSSHKESRPPKPERPQ